MSLLQKIRRCIPYIIIGVVCSSIFLVPFGNADEIWNYNFARTIAQGLLPYKDISMVQTPLAAYVSAFFLEVFGEGLIAYRIAGYTLNILIFWLFYKVGNLILKKSSLSLTFTLFMYALSFPHIIYNYNTFSLFLLLLIFLLEITQGSENNKRNNVVQGLLFGILPIVKQNTGAILFLVNVGICIWEIRKNKEEYNVYKNRLFISFIPGTIYFGTLIATCTLGDFIDYAVFGIGEFVHRRTYFEFLMSSPLAFCYGVLPIAVVCIVLYKSVVKREGDKHRHKLEILGIAWFFSVTYPLFDMPHYFPGILLLILIVYYHFKYDTVTAKQGIVCIVLGIIVAAFSITREVPFGEKYQWSSILCYKGVLINTELEKSISEVSEYIEETNEKGIDVYIAYEYAAVYMIPRDQYHKNWDMLLLGNFGKTSLEDFLDINHDSVILVQKEEYSMNVQVYDALIEYIRTNYKCIGEVQHFDIYKME